MNTAYIPLSNVPIKTRPFKAHNSPFFFRLVKCHVWYQDSLFDPALSVDTYTHFLSLSCIQSYPLPDSFVNIFPLCINKTIPQSSVVPNWSFILVIIDISRIKSCLVTSIEHIKAWYPWKVVTILIASMWRKVNLCVWSWHGLISVIVLLALLHTYIIWIAVYWIRMCE